MERFVRIYSLGNSRVMNVSKLFPKDWIGVKVKVLEYKDDCVVVMFKGIRG